MSLLSLRLNEVDTSMPLLTDGDYHLIIDSAELADAKSAPGAQNLKVVFATTRDESTQNGSTISAGYKLTRFYPIPSEVRDADKNDMFMKGLTLLALAAAGLPNNASGKEALPPFDLDFISAMAGKTVLAKIKTSKPKEGDEYGPKSEIASVRCLAD